MPLKLKIKFWFIEIVAALFVLLFLYTAISKLKDYKHFARVMLHSPLIAHYALYLSITVPSIELIAVVLLIIPTWRRAGIILSTVLMIVFTVYIGYMLFTSSNLPCTCGGIFEHMAWQKHFVFNCVFLLLGISTIFLYNPKWSRVILTKKTKL
jgi:hypothetical protein